MLGLALLGSGRMADVYGPKINAHPGFHLVTIYNPRLASAEKAVARHGGTADDDLARVLGDDRIDAVIIATPTDTHLEYVQACAKAGKPVYCEKPLDMTLERVDKCLDALAAHPVPFMLGFNRRFDPDIRRLQTAVRDGEIGALTFLMSWSREPAPPPIAYVRRSGGYFIDATIHDIDLLCWIAGERPAEVFASGSCLFDPAIAAEGDVDATMTVMKMPSGCLAHVNNSRACAYGFDQRLEAFGRDGMLQTRNHRDDNLVRWDDTRTNASMPLKHFFLERYDASFYHALDEFHRALTEERAPSCTAADGRTALAIALACERSRREHRAVEPEYV
ncbi:Gfo/Idh/MocA family oxidoreductase [Pseudohoeflea coraliihabitans]|uniref:Gfo/Idh/MocA family oxidoreductase n=1 Tax=Pseudohoeflea coraliihabitans TaxID=2860393 RepID=A0ABS6WTB8_9HYPH|nr:Gfo/Idh/MocA family oxidoreductase [Pseudohoeflea sp. DP4N28-3]MBW3099035.1 Gfo/Idh/MocA family oxidoreductase [Pseudohoeflea sp. DP4N28-3]